MACRGVVVGSGLFFGKQRSLYNNNFVTSSSNIRLFVSRCKNKKYFSTSTTARTTVNSSNNMFTTRLQQQRQQHSQYQPTIINNKSQCSCSSIIIIRRRNMVTITKTSSSSSSNPIVIDVEKSNNNKNVIITTSSTTDLQQKDQQKQQEEQQQEEEVYITNSCIERIKTLANKKNIPLNEIYLRVYVDAGGCSGFQYKFELTKDIDEKIDYNNLTEDGDDVIFDKYNDGTRIVIDKTSLNLLRGSTIDYVQEMIKSSFAITNNPQSESACGCGSSFAVKNFEENPALD